MRAFKFVLALLVLSACSSKLPVPSNLQQENLRIAFGSCSDQNKSQLHWNRIQAERPDLLILMGDNVYPDRSGPILSELRKAYQSLEQDENFRRLRETVPLLATWDDHDYGMNDGGADFAYREQSERLFLNFLKEPWNSERRRRPGVYDSVVVGAPGQRLQIILLDTRYFRSPLKRKEALVSGRGPYAPETDPAATMLGEAQWKWLAKQLEEPADLRILVSSIQFIAVEHGWESWGNLPLERQRLIDLIREKRAENLMIISGDRHHASLWRYRPANLYPLMEATSSSLNSPLREEWRLQPREAHRRGPLEHEPNFGLIDISWAESRVEISIVHSENNDRLLSESFSLRELRFQN